MLRWSACTSKSIIFFSLSSVSYLPSCLLFFLSLMSLWFSLLVCLEGHVSFRGRGLCRGCFVSPEQQIVRVKCFYLLCRDAFYCHSGYHDFWLLGQENNLYNVPSVRGPSVSELSLNLMQRFLSTFGCCIPWAICGGIFFCLFFDKNYFIFIFSFWFFFTNILFSLSWDPTGAKISKHYSSNKSQPQAFKLFLNFLPNGPHVWDFLNFENWHFNEFYSFSLALDHMGVNISQRYCSWKSQPNFFELLLNFPSNGPHNITVGMFEILTFPF